MRRLDGPVLARWRLRTPEVLAFLGGRPEAEAGVFALPSGLLVVACTQGRDWDHVSVSRRDRTPSWAEMCHVHGLFFRADEWAMQLHPPAHENVSYHDHCLHLFRPRRVGIPLPPKWVVGPYPGWKAEAEAAGVA